MTARQTEKNAARCGRHFEKTQGHGCHGPHVVGANVVGANNNSPLQRIFCPYDNIVLMFL